MSKFHMYISQNENDDNVLNAYFVKPCNVPEMLKFMQSIDNLKGLVVIGDYLDSLDIPDGIESVVCSRLGLKRIHVPDSVKWLYCNDNFLEELEVPRNIKYLIAGDNLLHTLKFRGGPSCDLELLEINNNRFSRFDFDLPDSCEVVMGGQRYPIEFMTNSVRRAIERSDVPYAF